MTEVQNKPLPPPQEFPLKELLARVRSRPWLSLAWVAALIQVVFVLETNRNVAFLVPVVDAAAYHNQALQINAGAVAPEPFWQPPLYPYVLAFFYRVLPGGTTVVRVAHALLGIITAVLVFLVARRFMDMKSAWLSGLVVCLYGPLLFFFSQLLPTGMAVMLNTAALLLALHFLAHPSKQMAFITGLAFGLAALAVPNILSVLLVLVAWLALRVRATQQFKEPIILGTLIIGGILVCVLPVTIRNRWVSGEWVCISTNAGINLYVGNNPDAKETIATRPGYDWEQLVALPFKQGAKTHAQADAYFRKQTRTFAVSNPMRFLQGLITKAWHMINAFETPRNVSIYTFRNYSSILPWLTWRVNSFAFPFGILFPLAICGLIANGRKRNVLFLAAWILVYSASVVLFFPSARYRLPIVPPMIILAALGVKELSALRRHNLKSRAGRVAGLLLAAVLVNLPIHPPAEEVDFESELHMNLGVGFQVRGKLAEAMEHYDQALEIQPANAHAHYYRGTAQKALGQIVPAAASFRKALSLRPDHEKAMLDLAVLLFENNQPQPSIELLRELVVQNPFNRRAMMNLGVGLLSLGKKHEATLWLDRARQLDKLGSR